MSTTEQKAQIAQEIWAVMREHEDRCDLEVEDVWPEHMLWAITDIVVRRLPAENEALRSRMDTTLTMVEQANKTSTELLRERNSLRAQVEALKKLAEQVPWITGDWTESQKAMEPEFAKVLEESAFDLIGTPSLTRPAVPEDFLEIPDVEDESGINTHYSRDLVLECIAAALAAAPQPEGGA